MSRPRKALRRFFSCRTPGALRRLRAAGEDGFTLIELVIVLVILPLVIGTIAYALIITLQSQAGITTKISDSVDSQLSSTYFVRDVQSAQHVTTTATPSNAAQATAGRSDCVTQSAALHLTQQVTVHTLLASFEWMTGTVETVVSYWRGQIGRGRATVSGRSLTSTTPALQFSGAEVGQGVVAIGTSPIIPAGTTLHTVQSPAAATLSATATSPGTHSITVAVAPRLIREICRGGTPPVVSLTSTDFLAQLTTARLSCTSAQPTCTALASTSWVPSQWISAVTLAAAEPAGKYDYALSASPRASTSQSGPAGLCTQAGCLGGKVPALFALGGGGVVTEQSSDKGHGGVHKTSITVTGTAAFNTGYLVMHNNTAFHATPIEGTHTPCTTTAYPTATCTQTVTTLPAHITTRILDPFRNMPDPAAESTRACPTSTTVISPGQYDCIFKVTGHRTVKMRPGIYELDYGLTVNGNGTLEMATTNPGTGVLIYIPCNVSKNGNQVDHWAPGCSGSVHIGGGTLSLRATLGSIYGQIAFWQNRGDTKTFTVTAGGVKTTTPSSLTITGVLYAPKATVGLSGLGTSTTPVGAVVATKFTVSNSHIKITGF